MKIDSGTTASDASGGNTTGDQGSEITAPQPAGPGDLLVVGEDGVTVRRIGRHSKLFGAALEIYKTPAERAALRCALADAAAICDMIAAGIMQERKGREGKGPTTILGNMLAAVAKRCGDEIFASRELIKVTERTVTAQAKPATTPLS